MGEAKRRKELGLPPKIKKNETTPKPANAFENFRRNPLLPFILIGGFVIFLIYDLIKYYNN